MQDHAPRPTSSLSARSTPEYAEASIGHPLDPGPSPQLPKRASLQEAPQSSTPYAVYHRSSTSRSSLNLTGVAPSPPVSSPTTGSSTVQPSSSGSETATSKLQFQTLQGQVQRAGLKPDSLGWAFVLSLVHNEAPSKTSLKGKERERDLQQWHKVVELIEQPPAQDLKIYVLLPKETASHKFSLAALATHILLVKPQEQVPEGEESYQRVVTLSGLRGRLVGQRLTFIDYAPGFPSPLPEFDLESETFINALFGPPQNPYMGSPSFQIQTYEGPLSVPRQAPPPLPRQETNASRAKAAGSAATSRLASLFGGTGAGSGHRSTPSLVSNATPSDLSTKGSQASEKETEPLAPLNLNVMLVERIISWPDVTSSISDSVALHLRSDLLSAFQAQRLVGRFQNLEELTELVVNFLKRFQPPLHLKQSSTTASWDWLPPSPSKLKPRDQEKCDLSLFSDPSGQLSADLVSNAMQDLYEIVRQSLKQPTSPSATDDEKQQYQGDFEDSIDQVIEIVEATLTSLLYDKLFSMQCAGDAADDDALSSRVAGLGLLQLTLTHLGLDLDPEGAEPDFEDDLTSQEGRLTVDELHTIQTNLDELVKLCGAEMKKLSDADRRSPAAKLDILIQAHKLIVDKLSNLPPIPMRRESTAADNASIHSRPKGAEVEMTDDARSLGGRSRAPSRASSPPLLESTPRPNSLHRLGSDDQMPEFHLSDAAIPPAPPQNQEELASAKKDSRKKGSSADVILPLLIYSVVQANPQQLASNLAFIQRFRAESLQAGGESMYCLVNFQAVVEFLLNVNVESLGLASDKIVDANDASTSASSVRSSASKVPSIRLRNEIDNIAGHVSSTINGVGGMVGFFLHKTATAAPGKTIEDVRSVLSGSSGLQPLNQLVEDEASGEVKESIGAGILRRARERSKSVASTLSRKEPVEVREKELQDVSSNESVQEESFASETSRGDTSFTATPDPSRSSISNRISALARFGSASSVSLLPSGNTTSNTGSPANSGGGGRTTAQSIFASFSPAPSLRSGASSIHEASPPTRPFALPGFSAAEREGVNLAGTAENLDAPPVSRFLQAKSAMELPLGDVQLLLDDYKRLARLVELQQSQRSHIG